MKHGKINFHFLTPKYAHRFGDAPTGNEILTGLLSTVYKLDKDKIAEILKDGATAPEVLSAIVELDKTRVTDLTNKLGKDKFQEGYKKAKAEVLTLSETELKTHYGIESDKTGADLVAEIVEAKAKEAGATTEDAIKKTPTYKELQSRLTKEVNAVKEEMKTKITEMESGYKKNEQFATVGKNAIDILTGLNPILPKNATVAETYKTDFLNELKGFDYELKDGKVLVSKDGKLLEDAHGHVISYDEHVKAIAGKRFEFAANNGGANGGNDNAKPGGAAGAGGAPGAYPANITKPKNAQELSKIITDPKVKPEDKRVVMDTYKKENAAP